MNGIYQPKRPKKHFPSFETKGVARQTFSIFGRNRNLLFRNSMCRPSLSMCTDIFKNLLAKWRTKILSNREANSVYPRNGYRSFIEKFGIFKMNYYLLIDITFAFVPFFALNSVRTTMAVVTAKNAKMMYSI